MNSNRSAASRGALRDATHLVRQQRGVGCDDDDDGAALLGLGCLSRLQVRDLLADRYAGNYVVGALVQSNYGIRGANPTNGTQM